MDKPVHTCSRCTVRFKAFGVQPDGQGGYLCGACAWADARARMLRPDWAPSFSASRGMLYTNVRYPSGASGCVAKVADGWMIACDERPRAVTYRGRVSAARAERELVLAMDSPKVELA